MDHGPDCEECYARRKYYCRHCGKHIVKDNKGTWFHAGLAGEPRDMVCPQTVAEPSD